MMPYQPYSKALTRQQEKDRSRSHERARPGFAPPFALNMEHGLRRTGPPPEDEMGQHLIAEAEKKLLAASEVGRQFRRKPRLIVPNCAQILPQRYKKEYEDTLERQYHMQEAELNVI